MNAEAARRLGSLLAEPGAAALLRAIEAAGAAARIVGGAVRNALMGIDIADIDLATTALPEEVTAIARRQGWKVVPTGVEHGTVTVVIDGRPYEITTLREDIATDGRRAEVRFGQDFHADAARRDFTVNAMSLGLDGVLHDAFGGVEDLVARRVRFIGDPDQRLCEDFLRGLRFLRFSANYAEGPLDPAGLAAVRRQQGGFARLSRERIRGEMFKLVAAPRALPVMREAEAHGLIAALVGQVPDLARFERLLAREASAPAPPIVRMFALFVPDAAALEALRLSLRLSNREEVLARSLLQALALHDQGADARGIAYRQPDAASFLPLLTPQPIEPLPPPPVFGLKGADLLRAGLPAGPEIGRKLAMIEESWIAAGLPEGRVAQRILMKKALALP